MKTFHFLFFVSTSHLKEIAQKYGPDGFYIDISYTGNGYSFIGVYYIGAGEARHRWINWSDKLYNEIDQAARNNYRSQFERATA